MMKCQRKNKKRHMFLSHILRQVNRFHLTSQLVRLNWKIQHRRVSARRITFKRPPNPLGNLRNVPEVFFHRVSNAQHGNPCLPTSAEVSNCQPVEETDLPAVPVVRPVHEPLHDERSWSHCRQTQSAPLRRAHDDHVFDTSRRLRHSAELATITFSIPPVVRVTPQSSRRHVHHGIHHVKYLKRLA